MTANDTAAAISWRQIRPLIGAEIRADKAELLSGAHAGVLRELLEMRGVLVFPEVDFDEAELIAFTKTIGTLASDYPDERPTAISVDPRLGANADYTRASFFWHFDGYMHDEPILASIMCGKVLSSVGGNTEFCNTYAAYEALPEERKQQIAGLRAVHSLAAAQLSVEPEPRYATFAQWQKVPGKTLPLVWKHRSGRKSLVIGNTAANIVGMDPIEGLELLVWLRDWSTQERFRYSHGWSPGDCVMWDNTGTLHRVTPYPLNSGRLMMRTKLAGEEAIA